jgi:Lrp/AsnC family transcriptional regulator for asnA, asnC and gidA
VAPGGRLAAAARSLISRIRPLQIDEISHILAESLRIHLQSPESCVKLVGMPPSNARQLPDEVSRAIIAQLQEDGRRPYAAIGKAIGLSEAAVRQRVQRLIDSGVMQVVAVTDPMQVGLARQAMIAISVTGNSEVVADELAKIDEVDYIVITAGSFDIMAEVVVADDDQLLELIGRIRSVPGVLRTETFLYLKLTKQTYNWGVR